MHGTTAHIVGSEDSIRKKLHPVQFARHFEEICIKDENIFAPIVLTYTSGCAGSGFDCSDTALVSRLGVPTRIINITQEMGRCGRMA